MNKHEGSETLYYSRAASYRPRRVGCCSRSRDTSIAGQPRSRRLFRWATYWCSRAVLTGTLMVAAGLAARPCAAEESVFSGPQVGEPLPGFEARGVYDDQSGQTIDIVQLAASKPLVLVFVHPPVTRPSAAVARGIAAYGAQHAKEILHATIWLHDDRSAAEAYLRRARRSLQLQGLVLLSLDGAEGPGALGLNRDVGLTVLVARDGKVTANFALVQPSTTDGPQIIQAIAGTAGTPEVTQQVFDALCYGRDNAMQREMRSAADGATIPRPLLAAVINRQANEQQVQAAAEAVEAYVGSDAKRQRELGRIARTVVGSGKLENYGTAAAQEQLRVWAKRYGERGESDDSRSAPPPADEPRDRDEDSGNRATGDEPR